MRPRDIFMHRTVIGWVIYVGRHCRRTKIFYLPQPGIEPRLLDIQATLYHVAVKAGFYRKAVEVYLYIPRPCDMKQKNFMPFKMNRIIFFSRKEQGHG